MNTTDLLQTAVNPVSRLSAILLLLFALSCPAPAHVPILAGDNDNITGALHISDAAKSWAAYGSLGGGAHYYSIDVQQGDRIYLSLFKSADPGEGDFQPALALLGPGLPPENSTLPRSSLRLSLPPWASELKTLAAEASGAASAVYEPFGPSSFIEISEINITAPESARYYAAVYNANNNNRNNSSILADNGSSGHYGLAVGYKEQFSFSDRITTPLRLISVYLWEGQSLAMILIPYFAAELIGFLAFLRGSRRTYFCLAGTLAGFFFLATAATIINQMAFSLTRAPFGPEVYITLAIALFNVLLGVAAIRLARGEAGVLQRALLTVLGTIALLAGSGLLLGPLLAMAASFLPSRRGSILAVRG